MQIFVFLCVGRDNHIANDGVVTYTDPHLFAPPEGTANFKICLTYIQVVNYINFVKNH